MLAPVSGQPCRVEQRVSIEVSNRRVDSWVLTKRRKMAPHVPCSFFGSLEVLASHPYPNTGK
jgi:hypothetical protein